MVIACRQGNLRQEQNPAYGLLRPIFTPAINSSLSMDRTFMHHRNQKDTETWRIAVETCSAEFEQLSPGHRARLLPMIRQAMACKEELNRLFGELDGGSVCALCQGECCQTGLYHVTVVELLSYLVTDREIFSPRFDTGSCPFLGDTGCLMEPAFRPYNCVTFLCDRLDGGLSAEQRIAFAALSGQLLDSCRAIEALFANRFMSGILNNGDRYLAGKSAGILWTISSSVEGPY